MIIGWWNKSIKESDRAPPFLSWGWTENSLTLGWSVHQITVSSFSLLRFHLSIDALALSFDHSSNTISTVWKKKEKNIIYSGSSVLNKIRYGAVTRWNTFISFFKFNRVLKSDRWITVGRKFLSANIFHQNVMTSICRFKKIKICVFFCYLAFSG